MIKKALILACTIVLLVADVTFAQTAQTQTKSPLFDYTENDIQTYDPNDNLELCASTGQSVNGFNPDPAAMKIYNDVIKPKMARLVPLYQRAARLENFNDWQLLAGIHYAEFSLQTHNPTTNLGFRGVFQMSANTLSSAGINPHTSPFVPGQELSDDQFVTQARAAIKVFLKPKSQARTVAVDVSKPLSVESALKLSISYKSGEGSSWLTGGGDRNLHAYSWAGFDESPQHALPMAWGPGSPYGDERPGSLRSIPGTLTVWGILKGSDIGSLTSADCQGEDGNLQPITGDRAELVQRILSNNKLKLGNYGNGVTQESDIRNKLTINNLRLIVAMLEQSGVGIPVNALVSDHSNNGGHHPQGRAIDVGYYGNGSRCIAHRGAPPCNSPAGNKLYAFLYTNWKQLKIDQLIWQDPPSGQKCIGANGPVDCYAYYKGPTMDQHYHHIHIGVAN